MLRMRRNLSERIRRDVDPAATNANSTFRRRTIGITTSRSVRHHIATDQPPLTTPQTNDTSSNTPNLQPPSFDPLALVRRLPPTVAAFCHVKSARHLALFSRFERFWLRLHGTIVVMIAEGHTWADGASRKENVIAGVFCVQRCLLYRSRSKSTVLRLTKLAHSHHVWLKFEDEQTCDVWEKALTKAASQRVVGISDFEFISPIGKGASGKVFLVADRKTGEKLALKVIDKRKVFESRSGYRHALDERLALEKVDGHPFFCRLRYAFQTRAYFYLAVDFYNGGDLYQYLRTHNGRLKEPQVRNVAAEVCLALEHLHNLGFVYRDLKPENVLLDSKGHVRLADFGLCKLLPNRSLTNTICGTHTYAAPEMLSLRNYGISIDLWAYGVFVYHILRGRTPYEARDLDQVIANMNNRKIRFSSGTSPQLVSMIKKLLDWNPDTRLGCGIGGMVEVRGHTFFQGVDWRKVYAREQEGLFSNTGPTTRNRAEPAQDSSAGSANDSNPTDTIESSSQNPTASITPAQPGPSTCQAVHAANEASDAPSPNVLLSGRSQIAAATKASRSSNAETVTTWSETESATSPRTNKAMRMARIRSTPPRARQRVPTELTESVSLRERMVAASEEDDLKNFDMSEWGKISVDIDHDDITYGDGCLWPISKARRRLTEDERFIAGFAYCSSSTPLGMPDNL